MGLMGIVLGLGPTLGPAAGGWIVDTLSWQYIFFFLTIGSIIVIPLALLTLTDVLPMSDPTIDWISIRHSVIGFGLLLFGLSILGSDGFDSILAWLAVAIGGFFVYLFFKRNLHAKEPMLDVSLFKNKTFLIAVIITMLGLMVITGISNVMPIYVQTTLGRTATLSGLIVLPGGMFKAFISPFIGRVYDRFGTSFIGPFGALVMVLGTLMLVFVSETTSISYIILSHLIMSFGFGIFNIPITTAGMNALPDEAMGHGTSARQTVRQIGSSFAITLVFATMSIVSNVFSSAASGLSGNGNELSIQGIQGGFAMVALFAIIAFVLTFFIREEKTEKA